MGLKLRMGLALSGLALSSMFGVNLLSGIKDYVDTTGNIMVDIADGIGMVSKGIEALEYYIDPSAEKDKPAATGEVPPVVGVPPIAGVPPDAGVPPVAGVPPIPPAPPGSVPGSLPLDAHPAPGDQPAVFCQKGKCYPYDPTRLKGVNLEAKPGMIIQAAPRPQKPSPVPPKAGAKGKARRNENEDEDEGEERVRGRGAKAKPDRR